MVLVMGFPRFTGVKRLEGSSMPFENYLKQIHGLYPNIPDMYVHYLQMVYEFDATQLKRLLLLNEVELSEVIVANMFETLQSVKDENNELFTSFVETYSYKERASDLFDILGEGVSFEEWLNLIGLMYEDDPISYLYYMGLAHSFMTNEIDTKMLLTGTDDTIETMVESVIKADMENLKQRMMHYINSDEKRIVYHPTQPMSWEMYKFQDYIETLIACLGEIFEYGNLTVTDTDMRSCVGDLINDFFNESLYYLEASKTDFPNDFEYGQDNEMYDFKNRVIDLFNIQAGGGGGMGMMVKNRVYGLNGFMFDQSLDPENYVDNLGNNLYFGTLTNKEDSLLHGYLLVELWSEQNLTDDTAIDYEFTVDSEYQSFGSLQSTINFSSKDGVTHTAMIPIAVQELSADSYDMRLTINTEKTTAVRLTITKLEIMLIGSSIEFKSGNGPS